MSGAGLRAPSARSARLRCSLAPRGGAAAMGSSVAVDEAEANAMRLLTQGIVSP